MQTKLSASWLKSIEKNIFEKVIFDVIIWTV